MAVIVISYPFPIFAPLKSRVSSIRASISSISSIVRWEVSKITDVNLQFFKKLFLGVGRGWEIIPNLSATSRPWWEKFHYWIVPFLRGLFWCYSIWRVFYSSSSDAPNVWVSITLILFLVEVVLLLGDTTIAKRLDRDSLVLTTRFTQSTFILGGLLVAIGYLILTKQCMDLAPYLIGFTVIARTIQAFMQNNIDKLIYEDMPRNETEPVSFKK